MRILAFSDLHVDLDQAARLAAESGDVDAVLGVGDFASVHSGLDETIEALRPITKPVILVPGNNETEDALREACAGWASATVLHGESARIDGVEFFGLGAGIPVTPWDWSFDLPEDAAAKLLAECPEGGVLAVHSPPHGHVDVSSSGEHLGSVAVRDAIAEKQPHLALCGHIHESWGQRSEIGETEVINLGPRGTVLEVDRGPEKGPRPRRD
jgi:Icc-related predicted phosphoesterase